MDLIQELVKLYFYIINQKPTKMTHSGYEKDRFVGLNFDEFDCIICSQVVMDPVECENCGKMFCKICINDWISKNPVTKCPNRCATTKFGALKSKALLRTYLALKIKCSNPKCGEAVPLGNLAEHEAICLKVKCWNFAVCNNPENQAFKMQKPCCSKLCTAVYALNANQADRKKMYQILTQYLKLNGNPPQNSLSSSTGKTGSSSTTSSDLVWDTTTLGTGIVVSEGNTNVFLKQQAYVFRTAIANVGYSSGVHYWEIIADGRTENQMKIGVTSSKNFDFNSAFCDHPFGWAYYGLGQLRHASNATGAVYGKRFKKDGVLGVCLNMNRGTLSFSLNGQNMGEAYSDEKLKTGTYYPAVSLLHCAGCKIKGSSSIPAIFNV